MKAVTGSSMAFKCFFGIVTHGYGDLEEFEIDAIESVSVFLLDQVFEDADVFGVRNLDSEPLLPVT